MKKKINTHSFAEWFSKKLRQSSKTQQEIASECGLSRSYITTLKTEKTNRRPSPGTLYLLALSLGADPEEAFTNAGIETSLLPGDPFRSCFHPGIVEKMKLEIAALKLATINHCEEAVGSPSV